MSNTMRLKDVDLNKCIGQTIMVTAIVTKFEIKDTKNNSKYINMTVSDNDVHINCKMWGVSDGAKEDLSGGGVFAFTISVETWEGHPSCIAKAYTKLDLNTLDYVETVKDVQSYKNLVVKSIEHIEPGSVYRKIVDSLITNDVIEHMATHAAASGNHHNIIGGLIQHTATMLKAGYAMAQVYGLNISLVMSGILLHDLGKLKELQCNLETGEIKYTAIGSLLGHITMMAIEIDKTAEKLGIDPDSEEVLLLKHCILAHHGKREWGSPVEPAIKEALLIHYLDGLDAEMYKLNREQSHIDPGTSVYDRGKVIYNPKG